MLVGLQEQNKEIPARLPGLQNPTQNTGQSTHLVPDSKVTTALRTHLPDPQTQSIVVISWTSYRETLTTRPHPHN